MLKYSWYNSGLINHPFSDVRKYTKKRVMSYKFKERESLAQEISKIEFWTVIIEMTYKVCDISIYKNSRITCGRSRNVKAPLDVNDIVKVICKTFKKKTYLKS